MNGSNALINALQSAGVELCVTNPGTSEMHLLAALDQSALRCVLALQENVVTGIADGYGRLARKPAATLLHLGPGLANGLANLHNARRAHTPLINIVGDQARYHLHLDAPLTSDINGLARTVSKHVDTLNGAATVTRQTTQAVARAMQAPCGVGTLIVPADVAWNEVAAAGAAQTTVAAPSAAPTAHAVTNAVEALRCGSSTTLLLGGDISARALQLASAIGKATGALVVCETFPTRIAHGAGICDIPRLPYLPEMSIDLLKNTQRLLLVGAVTPVSFFAYPGLPGTLVPADCQVTSLCPPAHPVDDTLVALTQALDIGAAPAPAPATMPPALGSGDFTPSAMARSIAALLPDNAIVVDEGITGGLEVFATTTQSPPHEWIIQGGGAIGWGLPAAAGAALACPDRKVLCLEGDGSGLYTLQALWTMARENLDVVTIIFANRQYAILQFEYLHVGHSQIGDKAMSQMRIDNPAVNYADLARALGVNAVTVTSIDDFNTQLAQALKRKGPFLIEAVY